MKYSILALGNEDNCTTLTNKLGATLKAYGSDLDVEFVNIVKEGLPALIARSKNVHAILMPVGDIQLTPVQRKVINEICKSNNLYATYTRYIDTDDTSVDGPFDFTIVQDSLGGMFAGENGFRTNPSSGREAYCVHSYSELDIEKVSRIAYELTQNSRKKITLADLDPHLATSNLWYKILTDINEDYPSTSVCCSQMRFVVQDIVSAPQNLDVVLSDSIVGKMLNCIANAVHDTDKFSCYVGDTPLALYTYEKSITQVGIDTLAKQILATSLGGIM